MNRSRSVPIPFVLFLGFVLAGPGIAQRTKQQALVKGRVVDAQGEPVANVPVAASWSVKDGQVIPKRGTTSGADGRFELRVTLMRGRNILVSALDLKERRGAVLRIDSENANANQAWTLDPLTRVHGTFREPESGGPTSGGNLYVDLGRPGEGRFRLFLGSYSAAGFEFWLPLGRYWITSYLGRLHTMSQMTFHVDGSKTEIDLGERSVEVTALGKMQGRSASAWNVTGARNLPEDLASKGKDITLADFQGRWLILEFWGYW